MAIINSITLTSYLVATLLYLFQWQPLQSQATRGTAKRSRYLISGVAIIAHSFLLYLWIDHSVSGQNLTLFNMVSLIAWLVALLAFVTHVYTNNLVGLPPLAFAIAMLSIALVIFFPATYDVNTIAFPQTLLHIFLAAITLSVLCLSGLIALLVIIQERQLRFKSIKLTRWSYLPPLQTMELLLFRTLSVGFALLSLVLITSLYSFSNQLTIRWVFDKAVLVLFAWSILGVLLIGHRWLGWRGYKAGYGTLAGVILLGLAYLGCQLILEGLH